MSMGVDMKQGLSWQEFVCAFSLMRFLKEPNGLVCPPSQKPRAKESQTCQELDGECQMGSPSLCMTLTWEHLCFIFIWSNTWPRGTLIVPHRCPERHPSIVPASAQFESLIVSQSFVIWLLHTLCLCMEHSNSKTHVPVCRCWAEKCTQKKRKRA